MANPLHELTAQGQSVWYDDLHRQLVQTGELRRLIDEDAVSGGTSNPTIFQKALEASDVYDEQLRSLVKQGKSAEEIADAMMQTDIRLCADSFLPIFERTGGADGYASIEVSPKLAYDTERSIQDAQRIFRELGRPNAMIKIPGTRAGLPAIKECLKQGVNINITLLFSVERYAEVAEAYLEALEERVTAGQPIDRIASVASFFVSRVDTLIDKKLDSEYAGDERAAQLKGKVAVANARLAYARFKEIFAGPRWQALADKGARVQRCLWASTSTKNPEYSDVLYVESLIGPDTINTMPHSTIRAFQDHGKVARTLDQDFDGARRIMQTLADLGVDFEAAADELESQGVSLFDESYEQTLATIRKAMSTRA